MRKRALFLAAIVATGVPLVAAAAPADAASHTYQTVGTNVNVRQTAFTGAPIVTTIPKAGTSVTVTCYTDGSSVNGDKWWYSTTVNGKHGYIAGYWLNTGHDPNPAVDFCGP